MPISLQKKLESQKWKDLFILLFHMVVRAINRYIRLSISILTNYVNSTALFVQLDCNLNKFRMHNSLNGFTFQLFKVRLRAREFFKDLCIKVKEVWDKEGNSGPPLLAGRSQRGASSLCSNSSEVFVSSESPVDNNNMAPPELVLDTIPTQGKHDNSGSTSSTSGYSSGGTDSCEQLSPLEPSHSPGANIPQSYEGGLFQNVHMASQHVCTVNSR